MQMRNKKYYKIPDSTEKLAIWQKEFDANISIIHPQFKEALLYFISKSWTNNILYSAKKYNSNISSLINGSTSIEPDEDFFVVNKTTWYSIKNRIRIKEKPFRKLGFFCNRKLVFIFDDLCYFFYKDRLINDNKIKEGYITFSKGQNLDNIIYILESCDINTFFNKTKADKELYKQILYYKGVTFELTLKQNIENRTSYNNTKNNINNYLNKNNIISQSQDKQNSIISNKNKYSFNSNRLPPIKKNKNDNTLSNDKKVKNYIEVKMYHDNSKKNIRMIDDDKPNIKNFNSNPSKISIEVKSREQSGKSYRKKNFLSQENVSESPEHFPEDRKLSKKEEDKLDKIIKCLIYYYCFTKKFMNELESSDGYKEINLCLINKEWIDFFLNKYSFYKIKEYLDKNYDNVEQRNFLEYKESISLNNVCNIKDFILVKTKPVQSLEKEFTEYGQEYYENYEFINKHTLDNLKDLFGSFDIEPAKEYKINILKDKGLIINYNSTKIEITKKYINENNNIIDNNDKDKDTKKGKENSNNLNTDINIKKPERYLIVLSNSKHMNYKVKRPIEDNGIDEGLKHIGIEKNEDEIDEETYQIKLKSEIIGTLVNITNPPNKTLGNFIPHKPCLIKLEKNTNIYCLNSVIQCLSNIPQLTGHLLNKKRILQIFIQREMKPLSYEYVEVLKNLWMNENIKIYSPKNISNFIQEMNPFLSGNESDIIKDLLFFLINNMHQELNKIENPSQYIPNNAVKYNFQLTFELYLNYFNANYKSIISDLFYGLKNDTITCDNCMSTSHSLNYYDIMNYSLEQIRVFKGYSYDTVYVEECFDYNERKIDLYNCKNYFCNFCNKYSNGILSSKLILIPKILILVLSRQEEKDFEINLIFEEYLNLRKYIFYDSNPYKYELIGVIININKYKEEKNYIAFCKSSVNKKWYLYDDDNDVIEVTFDKVKEKGKADILIYSCVASSK